MSLKSFYKREQFQPEIISIFINPFYLIRKTLFKEIKRNSYKLKGKLLDFGCGAKPYRNLFNVDEYIGVDIENKGHSHEKEEIDYFYDGKKLPFPDDSFDSLFCSEVFEHVFNLDEILTEIKRVMRNNSLALITTPFAWDEHEVPFDFARYSSFGMKAVLEKHGFQIVEQTKTNSFIEVIFQFWILYIYYFIKTKNNYLNIFLNIIFIAPFTLLGTIFSAILPRKDGLYHNNVILAVLKK